MPETPFVMPSECGNDSRVKAAPDKGDSAVYA